MPPGESAESKPTAPESAVPVPVSAGVQGSDQVPSDVPAASSAADSDGSLSPRRSLSRSRSGSTSSISKRLHRDPHPLTQRQVEHARLMLREVPELSKLRFQLCPKMLPEVDFWRIYFTLVAKRLPDSVFEDDYHSLRDEKAYRETKRLVHDELLEKQDNLQRFWLQFMHGTPECDDRTVITMVRRGVPDVVRGQVWMHLSNTGLFMAQHPSFFEDNLFAVYETRDTRKLPSKESVSLHCPNPMFNFKDHYLSPAGIAAANRVFELLGTEQSRDPTNGVPYRQQCLPDLVCLALSFMTEPQAYCFAHELLARPEPAFSLLGQFDAALFAPALVSLLEPFAPEAHAFLNGDLIKGDFCDLLTKWITRLFVGSMPIQTVLRIFDCFVLSGVVPLFQAAIQVVVECRELVAKLAADPSTGGHDVCEMLGKFARHLHHADGFVKAMCKVDLTAEDVEAAVQAQWNQSLPDLQLESTIIPDRPTLLKLWSWLPPRYALKGPVRVFSSSVDGFNLNTLIVQAESYLPTVLLIKTADHAVFGAFVTASWDHSTAGYRGTGETFLFRLLPEDVARKFPWSRKNSSFMTITRHEVILGSGENGPGLMLDDELDRGATNACATFANEPLTADGLTTDFQCVAVEVLGFR